MAKDKKSFLLYCDLIYTVNKLKDDRAGQLFKHILSYVNDENPEAKDEIIEIAFEPIKQSLKRDLKKYESKCLKNKENALKRWNANASKRIQPNANHADNDSDNDSDIKKKKIKKKVLFSDSEIFDFEIFCKTMSEYAESKYKDADMNYYYETVKNWSASNDNKKIDWVATSAGFMLRDINDDKFRKNKEFIDRQKRM